MSSGQENRRSFRIAESAFITYESISDLDFQLGIERWKMSKGSTIGVRSKLLEIEARFKEKLFVLKSESVALAECLHLLNEKIVTLMDELPGLREAKESLVKQPVQACELSADGMRFGVDDQMLADTKIAMRFLLTTDNLYVETFAKVVRTVSPPTDDQPQRSFGVAVEFLGMKPEQKDVLIQHLFDRESETLRMRRLQIEAEELKALTK